MVDYQRRDDIPKGSPTQNYINQHTLTADETFSHLALQYFGHATPPYWQLIYEANKVEIEDIPNKVRPGLVIKTPVLPEDMKHLLY